MTMAKTPISIEQSAQKVLEALAALGPRGYRSPYLGGANPNDTAALMHHLDIYWDLPAWAMDAAMSVRWVSIGKGFTPEVKVNWSSTHYTPGAAAAAAKLHTDVAAFACYVEHLISSDIITEERDADLEA